MVQVQEVLSIDIHMVSSVDSVGWSCFLLYKLPSYLTISRPKPAVLFLRVVFRDSCFLFFFFAEFVFICVYTLICAYTIIYYVVML